MRKRRRNRNLKIILSILAITLVLAFGLSVYVGIIGDNSQAFAGN